MNIQFIDGDQQLTISTSGNGISFLIDTIEKDGIDYSESRVVNIDSDDSMELCKFLATKVNEFKDE